jgi:serine protease Do
MNKVQRFLFTTVFALGFVSVPLLGCFAQNNTTRGELNLKTDKSPIDRDGNAPASYAPVIENVSPSIVNVFSTNVVKMDQRQMPFNDFFRRFFDRRDEQQDAPDEPLERRQRSLGSGVIISKDGYTLTNHHVVKNAEEIKVALTESDRELSAKLVGSDPKTDLAVLKIQHDEPLPVATLGDSSKIKVGDIAFAIGNPFGVGQTVTKGIVSAKSRGIGMLDYEKFIQTDASINPGNSGGALIDAEGRVIGINTVIMSRSGGSQGVGFSIPINLARSIATSIVEEGSVSRGFLGVNIQEITPQLKKIFNLERDDGVLISGVMDDLPADKAGLKRGDVIVSFDGNPVKDVRDLQFAVAQTSPGTNVSVGIIRDGEKQTVQLTLTERPSDDTLSQGPGGPAPGEPGALKELGITLSPITAQLRRRQDLPANVEGLVVSDVEPGSTAARSGLRPGDIVQEINRQPVQTLADVQKAVQAGSEDMVLLYVWRDGSGQYLTLERE